MNNNAHDGSSPSKHISTPPLGEVGRGLFFFYLTITLRALTVPSDSFSLIMFRPLCGCEISIPDGVKYRVAVTCALSATARLMPVVNFSPSFMSSVAPAPFSLLLTTLCTRAAS